MHSGEGLAGAAGPELDERRQVRLLARALLASLALHALMLAAPPVLKQAHPSRFSPPPLTAHLVKPQPRPKPVIKFPPPPPPPPRAAAKAARPAPAPIPSAPPAPVRAPEPAKQATEAALAMPAPPPQPALAPPVARAAPAPAAAAGADPGSVARFRLELMDVARRYKRYPRIAQDNNWEGRVELRVAYAGNGAAGAVTVKKSAGRAVLDEEAQAMIRSAQAQVALPPALRGRAFALEIPVEFSLKD